MSAYLFAWGPLALAHKSRIWYWGGVVAMLFASVHIAAYLNRTKQTFGGLVGVWIVFRNIAEVAAHIVVAVMAVDWFWYYMLLYWIVAYRYLDVGPRRLLYALYDTEAKRRARPWAPLLNWAMIVALYVLSAVAVYQQRITYLAPPPEDVVAHAATAADWVAVVAIDAAVLALFTWLGRGYRRSLARDRREGLERGSGARDGGGAALGTPRPTAYGATRHPRAGSHPPLVPLPCAHVPPP